MQIVAGAFLSLGLLIVREIFSVDNLVRSLSEVRVLMPTILAIVDVSVGVAVVFYDCGLHGLCHSVRLNWVDIHRLRGGVGRLGSNVGRFRGNIVNFRGRIRRLGRVRWSVRRQEWGVGWVRGSVGVRKSGSFGFGAAWH